MIQGLRKLLSSAKTPYQKARVLLVLIPSQFDVLSLNGYMSVDSWKNCADDISLIMEIVFTHDNIIVKDSVEDVDNDSECDKVI